MRVCVCRNFVHLWMLGIVLYYKMSKRCECETPAMKDCRKQIHQSRSEKQAGEPEPCQPAGLHNTAFCCDSAEHWGISLGLVALLISAWICCAGTQGRERRWRCVLDVQDSWGSSWLQGYVFCANLELLKCGAGGSCCPLFSSAFCSWSFG